MKGKARQGALLHEFLTELSVTRIANMQYFEMPVGYTSHPDSHPFCELIYVDSGEITVTSGGFSGRLCKNELLIHRAGEWHALRCDGDAPNLIIIGLECDSPRLIPFSEAPMPLSEALQPMLVEIVKEGRNVFLPPYDTPNRTDMEKRTDFPFGADQLIRNLLECFLIKLIREHESPHHGEGEHAADDLRTGEILRYLENNYREHITLEELCFLFGTNKTTLTRAFRRMTGDTVVGYLARLRLKTAKRLLREGKLSITEIAEHLNFSSVHYFTRFFSKHEKMSPSEYATSIRARFED